MMNRRAKVICLSMMALLFFFGSAHTAEVGPGDVEGGPGIMELLSNAFTEGSKIPKKHTCEGEDVSPKLTWSAPPPETKSLALICDDPDAPMGTWVHWVLFGLAPDTMELPEGVPEGDTVLGGAMHGRNDFGNLGYGGPCPPPGPDHRYFFKLYVLDTQLDLQAGATKADVVAAIEGHILAEAQLMGLYNR